MDNGVYTPLYFERKAKECGNKGREKIDKEIIVIWIYI